MKLHYVIGCDEKGILQAAKVRIIADTGAYASAGGPVVTRTGTHATSAYHIPSVDVHVKAVFTNNLPAGAFRGFGVNQSNFAMECLIDELCEKGGFDRWQFRYDNAVAPGRMVTTGRCSAKARPCAKPCSRYATPSAATPGRHRLRHQEFRHRQRHPRTLRLLP